MGEDRMPEDAATPADPQQGGDPPATLAGEFDDRTRGEEQTPEQEPSDEALPETQGEVPLMAELSDEGRGDAAPEEP